MSNKIKAILGSIYLIILTTFLYLIFSEFDVDRINDFSYYKELRINIEQLIGQNLYLNLIIFFTFSMIWVVLLGFGSPILILSGIVFDPIKKPGAIGLENEETHKVKQTLKLAKKYDQLTEIMKTIRAVDLRLVDISDFLIVHLDIDTHPCGTLEEIFLANRQKKPIIVHIQQGKHNCPDWLFGTIPHELFFDTWDGIISYLYHINTSANIDSLNRWYFLNE